MYVHDNMSKCHHITVRTGTIVNLFLYMMKKPYPLGSSKCLHILLHISGWNVDLRHSCAGPDIFYHALPLAHVIQSFFSSLFQRRFESTSEPRHLSDVGLEQIQSDPAKVMKLFVDKMLGESCIRR